MVGKRRISRAENQNLKHIRKPKFVNWIGTVVRNERSVISNHTKFHQYKAMEGLGPIRKRLNCIICMAIFLAKFLKIILKIRIRLISDANSQKIWQNWSIQKLSKALVTLGTLAVFLYVEIKSGSFGNNVFDQIQNHILSGISNIADQIEDTVEVGLFYSETLWMILLKT